MIEDLGASWVAKEAQEVFRNQKDTQTSIYPLGFYLLGLASDEP